MKFVVTAGPTREHLDPVRFLSNPSTGKMGFAIAAAAARAGHEVVLVTGPVALKTPNRVRRIDVVSAREMLSEVLKAAKGADWLVASAAVADWRPAKCAAKKLKKREMTGTLRLVRNPDILKTVRARRLPHLKLVGFAAETDSVIAEAERKCREKGLEFIVANDVSEAGSGFASDTNRVTLVFPKGEVMSLPRLSKRAVAQRIVRTIDKLAEESQQ